MRFLVPVAALLVSCSPIQAVAPYAASNDARPAGLIDVGDVDGPNMDLALAQIHARVEGGDRVVLLRISSFGGSVFAGLEFIQQVDELRKRGVRVECVVDTHAYSMGFVILQSSCDRRMMTRRSTLLAHEASAQAQGNATSLESEASFLRALSTALASVCAERMGMSLEAFQEKTAGRDWVLASEEALRMGAVDEIVSPLGLPPAFQW